VLAGEGAAHVTGRRPVEDFRRQSLEDVPGRQPGGLAAGENDESPGRVWFSGGVDPQYWYFRLEILDFTPKPISGRASPPKCDDPASFRADPARQCGRGNP